MCLRALLYFKKSFYMQGEGYDHHVEGRRQKGVRRARDLSRSRQKHRRRAGAFGGRREGGRQGRWISRTSSRATASWRSSRSKTRRACKSIATRRRTSWRRRSRRSSRPAKLAIGPTIENGFYYDIDFKTPITQEDLAKIEAEMKKIVKSNLPVERSPSRAKRRSN